MPYAIRLTPAAKRQLRRFVMDPYFRERLVLRIDGLADDPAQTGARSWRDTTTATASASATYASCTKSMTIRQVCWCWSSAIGATSTATYNGYSEADRAPTGFTTTAARGSGVTKKPLAFACGQPVTGRQQSFFGRPCWALFDPEGVLATSSCGMARSGPLKKTGTYTIETWWSGGPFVGDGPYSLSLQKVGGP